MKLIEKLSYLIAVAPISLKVLIALVIFAAALSGGHVPHFHISDLFSEVLR